MNTKTLRDKVVPILSGHLLLFGPRERFPYAADVGMRILLLCVLVEGCLRPALRAVVRGFGWTDNLWASYGLVAIELLLVLVLTRYWLRIAFAQIGLRHWQHWSSAEKWFFPQLLALGLIIFTVMRWPVLCQIPDRPDWVSMTLVVFAGQMIWGFYQEYVYRGLLQTELVRRWGAVAGILVSNLLFTFGPLHAYHFWIAMDNPAHLWMFAAIFAIGLYFAVLFHQSGNLWMVGVAHGLGDFFLDGLRHIT